MYLAFTTALPTFNCRQTNRLTHYFIEIHTKSKLFKKKITYSVNLRLLEIHFKWDLANA